MNGWFKICYKEGKNFQVAFFPNRSAYDRVILNYQRIYDMSKRNKIPTYLKSSHYADSTWKTFVNLT